MGLVPRHVELQPGHMVLQYGHQGMWATPRRTVKLSIRPVFSAYTRKPQPSESVYLITGVGPEGMGLGLRHMPDSSYSQG